MAARPAREQALDDVRSFEGLCNRAMAPRLTLVCVYSYDVALFVRLRRRPMAAPEREKARKKKQSANGKRKKLGEKTVRKLYKAMQVGGRCRSSRIIVGVGLGRYGVGK